MTNREQGHDKKMARRLSATMLAATALAGASCGAPSTTTSSGARAVSRILAAPARCERNRSAGTITYLTGFGWQSSVGILDPVAAEAEGFYHALCLQVRLEPGTGDATASAQLVASGRATLAELGSPSDAITASAGGIPVEAVATYGNTTASTLLTSPQVTNLRQLDGKTVGYKGAMPPIITAMLEKAGVDISSLHEVSVGYDPTILVRGQVQALTAYKSNEPIELRDQGDRFRQWDPNSVGLHGAFNVLDASVRFARANPGPLEDFLRATFEAYRWCGPHAARCVADAQRREPVGYDSHQNLQRWTAETKEVADSLPPGRGLGWESTSQWEPEERLLLADHLITHPVNLSALIAPQFVQAIEHGTALTWPGS